MVWGIISRDGERHLVQVDGKLNANFYIKILDDNLLDFDEVDQMIFMQDLAPYHRAVKTR